MYLSLLIKKRLQLNFYNALWVGSVALFVLACSLTTWLWAPRYSQRSQLYEADRLLHRRKLDPAALYMYSWVEVGIDRVPEKLSLFAEGTGERFGSCAVVKGIYVGPRLAQRDRENFFLSGAWPSDLTGVVILLISFLACLLTYNTICGERELGTLGLSLANSVPRAHLVIAEWLAALVTLTIPVVLVLLISGLVTKLLLEITYSLDDLLRVLLMFLSAIAFVSAWVLLGIAMSACLRSPTTTIILLLLIWVFWILLFPRATVWLVRLSSSPATLGSLQPADVDLWLAGVGSPVLTPAGVSGAGERDRALMQEQHLNNNLRQAESFRELHVFSPALSFQALVEGMARTDLTAHLHYYRQVQALDESLRTWQRQKLQRYPDREYRFRFGQGPLDLDGLPLMEHRPPTLAQSLRGVMAPSVALVVWNLIFFLLALIRVRNYDPRSG